MRAGSLLERWILETLLGKQGLEIRKERKPIKDSWLGRSLLWATNCAKGELLETV